MISISEVMQSPHYFILSEIGFFYLIFVKIGRIICSIINMAVLSKAETDLVANSWALAVPDIGKHGLAFFLK